MWSLGNESGIGGNLAAMAAVDPGARPVPAAALRGRPVLPRRRRLQPHVPDHAEVDAIGRGEEPPLRDPALDARRRAMPLILCEYAHAMGNGPGGLGEYQACSSRTHAARAGSSGSGSTTACAPHRRRPGVLRLRRRLRRAPPRRQLRRRRPAVPRPDPVPGPGRAQEGRRAGPHRRGPDGGLRIANLHAFLDLSHLAFSWSLEEEGVPVASGRLDAPRGGSGGSPTVPLPDLPPTHARDLADRPGRPRHRPAVGPGGPRGRLGPGPSPSRQVPPRRPGHPALAPPRPRWDVRPGGAAPAVHAPPRGTGVAAGAAGLRRAHWPAPGSASWRSPGRGWTCGGRRPTTTGGTTGRRWSRCGAASGCTGCGIGSTRSRSRVPPWSCGPGWRRRPPTWVWSPPTGGRPADGGLRLEVDDRPRGGVALPAAPGRAADGRAGRAPPGRVVRPRARARPTPTPAGRPGSAGSRPRWGAPDALPLPAGERRPPRRPLGDPHRGRRARPRVEGAPPFDLTVRPWTTERARPGPPPDRPRPRRPYLGQPRPGPAGHRLGLLRPRRPPRLPSRPRAGQLRGAAAPPAMTPA